MRPAAASVGPRQVTQVKVFSVSKGKRHKAKTPKPRGKRRRGDGCNLEANHRLQHRAVMDRAAYSSVSLIQGPESWFGCSVYPAFIHHSFNIQHTHIESLKKENKVNRSPVIAVLASPPEVFLLGLWCRIASHIDRLSEELIAAVTFVLLLFQTQKH